MMIPRLKAEQIEVKVKKVTEKGVIVLLYKTARTDMEILDEVFTPWGWSCRYDEIKGNLYCTISVRNSETGEWISKQDCGIESREDEEGNQKKGEASDSFKRAGFKWGIGRELYSSPFIFITAVVAPVEQRNSKWQLVNPFTDFSVTQIGYDADGRINKLAISDGKKMVFIYGHETSEGKAKEPEKDIDPESVITKDQYAYLIGLISTADKKIIPQEQEFLVKTYKEFGYAKAADIKQKDFKAICEKVSGKLPFDLN
jgi:hypothetical protein